MVVEHIHRTKFQGRILVDPNKEDLSEKGISGYLTSTITLAAQRPIGPEWRQGTKTYLIRSSNPNTQ